MCLSPLSITPKGLLVMRGHQMAQDSSQDVLLHALLNPLVQEALHMHIKDGICHILREVHLVKLQAVAQKVVYHTGQQHHLW